MLTILLVHVFYSFVIIYYINNQYIIYKRIYNNTYAGKVVNNNLLTLFVFIRLICSGLAGLTNFVLYNYWCKNCLFRPLRPPVFLLQNMILQFNCRNYEAGKCIFEAGKQSFLTGKLAFEAGKTSAEAWKNSSQATVSCCGMGQKRGHVALTRPHYWLLPIAFRLVLLVLLWKF